MTFQVILIVKMDGQGTGYEASKSRHYNGLSNIAKNSPDAMKIKHFNCQIRKQLYNTWYRMARVRSRSELILRLSFMICI